MTRKPNQKSEPSDQTKRDTQRKVEADQASPALEKTLKKAEGNKPKTEPEGRDD
jgi:hypothetical protein